MSTMDCSGEGSEKGFQDSLMSVGELGLTLSDTYGDLPNPADGDSAEAPFTYCDTYQDVKPNILPMQGTRFKVMSLLVGDGPEAESLHERIRQAVPGHEVLRSRLDEAFVMCNCRRYQLIWLVMTTPVSQETLSFTTSIRYMYSSRLNQTTSIIGVSDKRPDVDLQSHGIDDVLVEMVRVGTIREIYLKWSTLGVPAGTSGMEKLRSLANGPQVSCSGGGDPHMSNSRPEEDMHVTLPLSPLLEALQEVRNNYQPRPKLPIISDHTTKEKMRRERIKDSCDQLRVLLPYIRGRKTDMASVLEMCVDYLRMVNIALPTEFKAEVADILGKDCQVNPSKTRSEPKSTPRKRKRDLNKPPESPSTTFVTSSLDSPMYTPPATPGSETGSESMASPLPFNPTIDQSMMSPLIQCFIKQEPFDPCLPQTKTLLPSSSRVREKTSQQRTTPNYVSIAQNDMFKSYSCEDIKVPNMTAVAGGIDYFNHSRAPLPGCFTFSSRPPDLSLHGQNSYPNAVGNGMNLADRDIFYKSCPDVDDTMCRFTGHPNFTMPTGSTFPIDSLANYVNPNAVLPISYATRYVDPTVPHHTGNETLPKSEI